MKVFHYEDVMPETLTEGVKGQVRIRWLVTRATGAENFAMRFFEVEPGAEASPHSHDWEHEVFILEGNGVMTGGDDDFELGPGSVVFIPGNEPHMLRNTGNKTMKYLCLIPTVSE
jgi:quercetin dioxygenase-like cupin family protein